MAIKRPLPPVLDRLVKAYYSVVLADFGIVGGTAYEEDMSLFRAWAEELPSLWRGTLGDESDSRDRLLFASLPERVGSIKVPSNDDSTIYTQYQCQVPRLKPAGSLVTSMFLADLVFLRALWWLLNLVTTLWLRRSDPLAMYCAGCSRHLGDGETTAATQQTPAVILRAATA